VVINPTPTGIHKTVVDKSGTDARKTSLTDTSSSKSPRSVTPLSPRDTSVTANGFKSPSPARDVVSPVEKQPQKEISPAPKETTPPPRETTPSPVPPVVKAPSPKPEASLTLEEREELLTKKVGILSICGEDTSYLWVTHYPLAGLAVIGHDQLTITQLSFNCSWLNVLSGKKGGELGQS